MPKWLDNAIFYEIYPQSFQDTNADGIGDFQGIINRLDYIKELGCNALWINPCYDSPFTDAGYDVRDYYKAAPRYGTNADLKRLFDEAHSRGMHVMLDLVPGHTSFDHPWFKQSMLPEKNEFTDRYVWSNNSWEGLEGVSGLCGYLRGISQRDACVGTNYYSTQPALNYGFENCDPNRPWQQPTDSEAAVATREEIKNIMRFWLGLGCDGFRVDMAGNLVKNDPEKKGNIRLWQNFRAFLDEEFPEAAIISEWGEPSDSLAGGFHMDFLLQFGTSHYVDLFRCKEPYFSRRGNGDASRFVERYKEHMAATGGRGLMCIPSGNHDSPRMRWFIDEEEMKIAYAFLLSMPGAPFIYYGDEIAMRYLSGITSVEGGYERTGARSPMQWDDTANAGFSSADPKKLYIQLDPSADRPTAAAAMADENSVYAEIKRLTRVRLAHEALQSNAAIEFMYAEPNAYPLVYKRSCAAETVIVALNPSGKEVTVDIDAADGKVIYSYGGEPSLKAGRLTMPAAGAAFFTL